MPSDPVEFSYKVVEHVTHMSGMIVGLSPLPVTAILKKHDTDVAEYIKSHCWYIDPAGVYVCLISHELTPSLYRNSTHTRPWKRIKVNVRFIY